MISIYVYIELIIKFLWGVEVLESGLFIFNVLVGIVLCKVFIIELYFKVNIENLNIKK